MKSPLRPFIIGALCVALLGTLAEGACAQEVLFQKRLDAVRAWARTSTTFQSTRPTFVFTCDVGVCVGCASSAINAICKDLRRQAIDANVIVVLLCHSGIEGKPFRKQFHYADVAIDSTGTAAALFGANAVVADVFVVDSSGALAFQMSDVQHEYLNIVPQVRARRAPGTSLGRASAAQVVRRLGENDEFSMISLTQPVCDDRGRIWTVEPQYHLLVAFDSCDTTDPRTISFEERLGRYFQSPTHDTAIWNFLASNYAPLVALDGIVSPAHHDTLVMLGSLFVGFDTVTVGTKKTYNWRREYCFITVVDTAVLGVERIGELSYGTADPFVGLSAGTLVCPGLWPGVLDDTRTSTDTSVAIHAPPPRDSTVAFLVISRANSASYAVRARAVDALARRTVDLEHPPLLAHDGQYLALVTSDSGFAFVFDPDTFDGREGAGGRYIGRVGENALAVVLRSDTLIVISQPSEAESYVRVERISLRDGGRSGHEVILPYRDLLMVWRVTGETSGPMEFIAKFEKERWMVLEF